MKGNGYSYKLPDLVTLKKHYFDEKMSASEIANKYDVTIGAVLIRFRRNNIKRRTMSEGQNIHANHIELNNTIIDFIEGLLLGDGCILVPPEGKSGTYSHSDKNYQYLEWLKTVFQSMGIECTEIKKNGKNAWSVKTKYYREFVYFRKKWYPGNKKVIPIDYLITPIGTFNWYIGDGSYYKYVKGKRNGGSKVVICSQFDQEGKIRLAEQLKSIGIDNSIYFDCIYIKSSGRKIFFEYIRNHNYSVPECYEYKF